MNSIELEKVLERVAELVDTKKSGLIRYAEPEHGMPASVLKDCSKGELVAELTYLDFTGRWRNRIEWYEPKD